METPTLFLLFWDIAVKLKVKVFSSLHSPYYLTRLYTVIIIRVLTTCERYSILYSYSIHVQPLNGLKAISKCQDRIFFLLYN